MRAFIVLMVTLLTSCTGVGYVATSDPHEKLRQAYSLMSEDRPLLAEDTIGKALKTYDENNDGLGQAEAYYAYGILYSDDSYRGRWRKLFEKMGTYDEDYSRCINNYEKAKRLFESSSSEIGVVKSLLGVGRCYAGRNDYASACNTYSSALTRYSEGKKSGAITKEPQFFDDRYKNTGEVIEGYMKYEKCNT